MALIHNQIIEYLAHDPINSLKVFENDFAENQPNYRKREIMAALGDLIENKIIFEKTMLSWIDEDDIERVEGIEDKHLEEFIALHNIQDYEVERGLSVYSESLESSESDEPIFGLTSDTRID